MRKYSERTSADGGEDRHESLVLDLTAAHIDRVDLVAFCVHLLEDLARLESDCLPKK